MTHHKTGGAPVGFITELSSLEAASVIYLRLWCDGCDAQSQISQDFSSALGAEQGRKAFNAFQCLFDLCARYGRRPLMRHATQCKCLGSDESCFATFVATATTGDREDALMIAMLLVRPDIAPVITGLAMDVGLALKRMQLRTQRTVAPLSHPTLLH